MAILRQLGFFDLDVEKGAQDSSGMQPLAYCNVCGRWAPRSAMELVPQFWALGEYRKYHGVQAPGEHLPGHFLCSCPEGMAWNCLRHGEPDTNGCPEWQYAPDRPEVRALTEESFGRWCSNCRYTQTIRDIVANPTGSAKHCVKDLNGNPDNRRMIEQEHREGYGPDTSRLDLLPPEPGQPLEWRAEDGEVRRLHLFQIEGIHLVNVRDRGPTYSIYGWVYQGGFSAFVEVDVAEWLMGLGVPYASGGVGVGGTTELKTHVMPVRKELGFVTDPLPHERNGVKDAEGGA